LSNNNKHYLSPLH